MTTQWEKVYVFISSTFNDMHAERDYLVKQIFPQLQEWCAQRKLRLVDIDLRWGVTEADATENKRVVQVCLQRIDICRPFFLCFLGQRRGWVPSKNDYPPEIFSQYPELEKYAGTTSVTELEILHALLNPLHRGRVILAGKEIEYKPADYSFFYLREPDYLTRLPADLPQFRQIYTNDGLETPQARQEADQQLRHWREQEIPQTGRPVTSYSADWLAQEQTPEIRLPLNCPSTSEPGSNVWNAAYKKWAEQWSRARIQVDPNGEISNPAELQKAEQYNAILTQGRLGDFTCDDKPLAESILNDLKIAIQTRYPVHLQSVDPSPLQRELDQQEQMLHAASEGFIKRTGDFDTLDKYLTSSSQQLFVLTAPGGLGKTSLLASWIDQLSINPTAGESLHYRFIGASDGSTTVDGLLRSILSEIKSLGKFTREIPTDSSKLRPAFPQLLEEAGKQGRTVIVLDGLNQLESQMSDLAWLSFKLPPGIKMIVSFKRGDEQDEHFCEQECKNGQALLSEVRPFEKLEHRRELVRIYLNQFLKELDERHLETLIGSEGASNPLFLKVALTELRVFGAFTNLGQKIRADFGTDPVTAFSGVLKRLENDPAYAPIEPKRAVPLLFGLLAHARSGLSASELSCLLLQALGLEDNPSTQRAASDSVYLYMRQVRPFLSFRDSRYDFFYESFKIAVRERYTSGFLGEILPKRTAQAWHQLLGTFFLAQPLYLAQQEVLPNLRKLMELPYHLAQAGDLEYENLISTLSDLDFIQTKCKAGKVYDLLEDLDRSKENTPKTQLNPIRKACSNSLDAILTRPDLTMQTLYNQLCWVQPLATSIKEGLTRAKDLLDETDYWIRALAPLPNRSAGLNWNTGYEIVSGIQSLSSDCSHIAVSNLKGEVIIHNLVYGKLVEHRKLDCPVKAIALCENPRRLAWIDQGDEVHSSDTTLKKQARPGETNLLFHPLGSIVFVNNESKLVEWNPETNVSVELTCDIPAPVSVLKFINDGNFILVAAGRDQPVILILELTDSGWKIRHTLRQSIPAVDIDYQTQSQRLVVLQKNRCLRILDLVDAKNNIELYYERHSTGKIIGAPFCCAIEKNESNSKVYFSTGQGAVGVWNWKDDNLEVYGECFTMFKPETFRYLCVLPKTEQVFYSTNIASGILSEQTQSAVSPFHKSEVLGCAITSENTVVSVGRQDNKVKWFSLNGLTLVNELTITDISVIRAYAVGEQILVGDHFGRLWIQPPGTEVAPFGEFQVFDSSIEDVFSENLNTAFVANAFGQVTFFDFSKDQKKIYRHRNNVGELLRILPAKNNGLFWSLNRSIEQPKDFDSPGFMDAVSPTSGNDIYSDLELVKENGIEHIYHSRVTLPDFSVSQDGNLVCMPSASLKKGIGIRIIRKTDSGWSSCCERIGDFSKAIFLGDKDQWLCTLDDNRPWLMILDVTDNLKTIASAVLPEAVTCMDIRNRHIILGCSSGELISYHLEWRK
ncbi:MAG: DUF4062 domain-containing protein [Chloroflexota bacterium]